MPAKTKAKIVKADVVAYIGTADAREIDATSWRNVDVDDQDKAVWDKNNKWQILAADLSDAALTWLETADGFVIRPANVDR